MGYGDRAAHDLMFTLSCFTVWVVVTVLPLLYGLPAASWVVVTVLHLLYGL